MSFTPRDQFNTNAPRREGPFNDNSTLTASDINRLVDNTIDLDARLESARHLGNLIYPVGSIYISVNADNPQAVFGGTWEAWGQGRVPVGVDPNDNDFRSNHHGGSKSAAVITHTHTTVSAGSHGHTAQAGGGHRHTTTLNGSHSHTIGTFRNTSGNRNNASGIAAAWFTNSNNRTAQSNSGWCNDSLNHYHTAEQGPTPATGGDHTHTTTDNGGHTHTINAPTGATAVNNNANLQPYITCFMWRRTAIAVGR